MSQSDEVREHQVKTVEAVVADAGLNFLGWRDVPVKSDILGKASRDCEPVSRQFFVGRGDAVEAGLDFERKLYLIRRTCSHKLHYGNEDSADDLDFHIVSLSSRTMTYKGMLTTWQLDEYFPDLSHEDMESTQPRTLVSPPTPSKRPRAQPFVIFAIMVKSTLCAATTTDYMLNGFLVKFRDDLEKLLPIIRADGSDKVR